MGICQDTAEGAANPCTLIQHLDRLDQGTRIQKEPEHQDIKEPEHQNTKEPKYKHQNTKKPEYQKPKEPHHEDSETAAHCISE